MATRRRVSKQTARPTPARRTTRPKSADDSARDALVAAVTNIAVATERNSAALEALTQHIAPLCVDAACRKVLGSIRTLDRAADLLSRIRAWRDGTGSFPDHEMAIWFGYATIHAFMDELKRVAEPVS